LDLGNHRPRNRFSLLFLTGLVGDQRSAPEDDPVDRWVARLCILAAVAFALAPRLAVASQWGSGYGDPPGFCPAQSRLPGSYLSLPPTNDPLVGNNPEQDTFFGFHSIPG